MKNTLENLPEDPSILKAMLASKSLEIERQNEELIYLRELVQLFQYKRFAPKSEKWEG